MAALKSLDKNRLCNHQIVNRLQSGLQKVLFCVVKDALLKCKRCPFTW